MLEGNDKLTESQYAMINHMYTGTEENIPTSQSTSTTTNPVSSQKDVSNIISSKDKESVANSSKQPSKPSSKPKPISSVAPSSKPKPPVSSKDEPIVIPSQDTPSQTPPDTNTSELVKILSGAVQAEIVGTNSTPNTKYYEAYKAQAVASHTYMENYKQNRGTYPNMPYRTPHPKTISLVEDVINDLIYYNGSVINAVYHAASGGYTQSASYVWGGNIPYLVAVSSSNDDYNNVCTISESETQIALSKIGVAASGDPATWFDFDSVTKTDGDFVDEITICGTTVTGRKLREQGLGASRLKSPKIQSIEYSNGVFRFTTKGYGHGVGMSQQGALGLSANGYSYSDILTHYYSGVQVR